MADLLQNRATKLFGNKIPVAGSGQSSRIKYNRADLITDEVADELNTYRTWDEFSVFSEGLYTPEYDENGKEITQPGTPVGAPGVRSIFNKSGAVLVGAGGQKPSENASDYRISQNVPLLDSSSNRMRQRNATACTIKDLVAASEKGLMGRETYAYSDFMYCKYLGRLPNTYMVTLRRFPIPVDDFISNIGTDTDLEAKRNDQTLSDMYPSIGCMVTWMGTPGNEMNNILKYSFNMPYEEKAAAEQTDLEGGADKNNNILNALSNAASATYRARYAEGYVGSSLNNFLKKVFDGGGKFADRILGDPAYDYRDLEFGRQDNKIYGPIDVVKKVYARGKEGLNFEQSITLVFEYEMKSYNGINQRQAFLDLISNILNVTYTTGTFWGGGYRIVGQPQNNLFTNLHIFRTKGEDGLNGYADALLKDIQDFLQNRDRIRLSDVDGDNWWQKAKNLLNSVAGMFVGGFLNNFGRPHKQFVQSILSPAPTGLWHLTIGNPRAPIMSMGNMIIKNTTIEHTGPLGIDEFPSGLKVTVELERGKPRDLRDIERMYMKGSDRIYISMGEKVLDMYKHAKEYKSSNTSNFVGDQNAQLPSSMPADTVIDASGNVVINDTHTSSMEDLQSEQSILLKYFGMSDQDAIIVTAKEQENGSQRIKSKSGAGDQGIGGGAMAI